jgi:hypothetical protein
VSHGHAQPRRIRQPDKAVFVGHNVIESQVKGELPRREGIFGDAVIRQARIWLQRGRERQVRGEGVIDEGHPLGNGMIRHLLGRADSANAPGIDLDEPDFAEVDEIQGHGR